jgi:hypothetical protein
MKNAAAKMPSEIRVEMIDTYIDAAKPKWSNPAFGILWDAYYSYIDPNGVPKTDCPICIGNVLQFWRDFKPYLEEAELNYQLLQSL